MGRYLREVSPHMGCYLREVSPHVPHVHMGCYLREVSVHICGVSYCNSRAAGHLAIDTECWSN